MVNMSAANARMRATRDFGMPQASSGDQITARRLTEAPADDLYETDFHAWTVREAGLLRTGDLHRADLANLAEEIETLGRSERSNLESAYRLVALHLLTLIVQKERATRSWLGTIARERNNAARCLRENPSLRPKRDELFAAAYRDARKEAQAKTGLPLSSFPPEPPFSLDQAEDEAFFPDA